MYCYLEKRGVVEGFPFVAFNSRYYLFWVGYFVPQPQMSMLFCQRLVVSSLFQHNMCGFVDLCGNSDSSSGFKAGGADQQTYMIGKRPAGGDGCCGQRLGKGLIGVEPNAGEVLNKLLKVSC